MRTEQIEQGENSTNSQSEMLINQLKEITGIRDPQILYRALKASQGDVGHAVGMLTTQPPEVQDPGDPEESGAPEEAWEGPKGIRKDELQAAIELSLQESRNAQEEEREFHRALEASAEENAARMKRKRCEAQGDMSNPADWMRQDDWPVGIRNVGNTCWFSAVIQSLFHLPVFRRLVLNYHPSERLLEKCKSHSDKRNIAFMQELRCLFALMLGSTRRFVDPSAAVELLRDAFRSTTQRTNRRNPMVQLFYGTFVTERKHEGKTLCNTEQFGQYPLQVNGFNNLDECLEGAMVEREIESLHSEHSVTPGRERWFNKLPPVLTFELSRFEFNTQLGRPEKIHKKLEFPQIIYMDRYLHRNIDQAHERRGEVKKLKEHLAVLQQKLECYKNYGSGPTKYPLADMLQFVLEFATTKPTSVSPAEDLRLAASSPTQSSPPLGEPTYRENGITDEELHSVKSCLQRWRTEVENDINELQASIDRLSQKLEGMYTDNSLCQAPYRLHAVLVHEGQASAGHYWAYIYDHANQRWMKYNDVCITESSWEELERDSFGGMTNASAYCLMYIDDRLPYLITEDTDDETGQMLHGMDSLPPVLRRYVHEDNRWFQQELSEWEEQFCQTAAPQGETTASVEIPNPDVQQAAVEPAPQSGPCTEEEEKEEEEEDQGAAEEPEPEEPEAEKDPEAEPGEKPEGQLLITLIDPRRTRVNTITTTTTPPPAQSPGLQPDDSSTAAVTDTDAPEPGPSSTSAEQEPQSQTPDPEAELRDPTSPDLHVEKDDKEVTDVGSKAEDETEASGGGGGGGGGAPEQEAEQKEETQQEDVPPARQRQTEDVVSEVEIPNVGRIMVRADADGYNEEMMLTPAMQGVILAIAKARHIFDKEGPEAGLIKAFHEEYCRLFELSQEETTPQEDPRLQHALVYFFQNNAPKRIIERTLLEQFTDRNLSFDERAISIMREARAKLRLIKPDDMDMDEYLQWQDDYRLFRTVFVYLLTGLEHYQHGKMREALNYLAHAYETNSSLLKNGEKRGVDKSLIGVYRRKCLTALNESASRLFCSGEESKVEEGVAIMDEAVIPCLHLMSRDLVPSQEDRDVTESIRSQWCCCLGQDMEDSLQVKLGELLPRVLDGAAEAVVLQDPPKVHVHQAHDLCSRLAAVMESIHSTTVVSVK
ncbi:unnamed protein product [Pleuronectes platessa]|uniref:ubiquitinyl hydrolase 1 n=1 Tax=Pleuronectes platessa TaxID=8262 RepID=A0A9N7YXK3_PLEPL|nr:unnamed protein product [Pleuronectes platessa]